MKRPLLDWIVNAFQNDTAPRLIQERILKHLEALGYREILPTYLNLRRHVAELGVVDYLRVVEEVEERIYQIILTKREPPTPEEAQQIRQNLVIVEKEFPEIRPSGDRDFELYLQARQREDRAAARNIYTRLLNKYPDMDTRANLLRFWRKGRGLFHVLYLEARLSLGRKLQGKIRAYISALTDAFAGTGNQTLALMGSIRQATRILPPNKQVALELLDKLLFYSGFLNWHPVEFQSISNILKSFYEETLFQQRKINLVTETEQARKKTTVVKQIDLQKVKFTKEDLQQILVSPHIQGTTNLTLAYCRKYWLMVGDPLFENKILLYSQKYRTWHHSIYQAIARGRMMRQDDEVILMNVYNVISRNLPYDYDIRREYTMQLIWRRIKPQAVVKKSLTPKPEEATPNAAAPPTPSAPAEPTSREPTGARPTRSAARPTSARSPKSPTSSRPRAVPKSPPKRLKAAPHAEETSTLPAAAKSILERIAEMDHSEQKNLHLVFRRNLEREIEEFIRATCYLQKVELKPYLVSLASISIKNFILDNLTVVNPDWKLSKERLEVKELGLDIEDIQPIIEKGLKSLRETADVS